MGQRKSRRGNVPQLFQIVDKFLARPPSSQENGRGNMILPIIIMKLRFAGVSAFAGMHL